MWRPGRKGRGRTARTPSPAAFYQPRIESLEARLAMTASPWSQLTRDAAAALLVGHSFVADEIVVLDSGSTDATEEICRNLGVRFETRRFDDFGRQRSHAISLCSHAWVLSIDSDETLSPQLRTRLLALKNDHFQHGDERPDGFKISRRWFALGQELHCFYPCVCPDHPVRLVRGDKVPVTLRFEKAGEITVSFDVQAMGATGPGPLSDAADPAIHSTAKM